MAYKLYINIYLSFYIFSIGDGIYDQITNQEVVECVWMTAKGNTQSVHSQAGLGVDMILKTSLARKSLDNVTCVLIAFEGFESIIEKRHMSNNTNMENHSNSNNHNNNNSNQNPNNNHPNNSHMGLRSDSKQGSRTTKMSGSNNKNMFSSNTNKN